MTSAEIDRLTPQERLDLIGALGDSISPQDIVLTSAQEAELARRLATFDADKRDAVGWETIEAELRARTL